MALSILASPIYTVGDAAGLLGLSRYKVMAWLDGSESGGRTYEPVVRPSRTGDKTVTWGEFVELGYLREYRRKGVPLQRLRPVRILHLATGKRHGPWMFAVTSVRMKEIVLNR